MGKDVQCIKYEKNQPKLREVSEVVSIFDPSILRELRDETADAKGAAEDAKTTADEDKKESGETKDAASDAKNAVDSVKSSIPDSVSALSGMDSETIKTDVQCMKYEKRNFNGRRK
jgi:hypothetical protein